MMIMIIMMMMLVVALTAAVAAVVVPTTTTVYAQIILNNTANGTTTNTTTTQPPQQQEQEGEEKELIIFANASTIKSSILSTLNLSDVTNATTYGNGTGIVIFKGGPANTSGLEIHFNHTCTLSNGCIYEDNTISVENNDTHMKAIQTE